MKNTECNCYDEIAASVFAIKLDQAGTPRYILWNKAAELESGVPRDRVIGKTAHDVYSDDYAEAEYQHHLTGLQSGDTLIYEGNCPFSAKSTLRRTTLTPKRDESGLISHFIGTRIDISAEEDTNRLQSALMSSNAETEQFVALAAHDLRTPMRNISILTDMLREDFVDRGDGKLQLIDLLDEVAVKSSGLLREVLTHTQEANAAPEVGVFDFDQLCHTIFDILDPRALHRATWPQTTLFADKTAMHIVLRNLFDNAIKHGQKTNLTIRTSIEQYGSDMISVQVQDNGSGFKNVGHAFREASSFRANQGYGLLSVRRLLTARGGTISALDRSDQQGSIIRFTLPGKIKAVGTDTQEPRPRVRKIG